MHKPTLKDYGELRDGMLWIHVAGGRQWGVGPDTDMTEFALGIYMHARETLQSVDVRAMPVENVADLVAHLASDMEFAEELLVAASPDDGSDDHDQR